MAISKRKPPRGSSLTAGHPPGAPPIAAPSTGGAPGPGVAPPIASAFSKVRVFVVDESGRPRRGAPLALVDAALSRTLSILQSDRAGYASFAVRAADPATPGSGAPNDSSKLRVQLLSDPAINVPAALDGLCVLTVRSDVVISQGPDWLQSIPQPDAADRSTSPSSFGTIADVVTGTEDCERILPGRLPEHVYRVTQLVPYVGPPFVDPNHPLILRGWLVVYRTTWNPVGHSLGDLAYTLPLAPCETVNLAVVDWARQDSASRREAAAFSEQLAHDEARDRTIDQTMAASLYERQNGWSFTNDGSVGYQGGGYSAAGTTGGIYGESNGFRDLTTSTVQDISDRIKQNSSAQRRLASSVIVQSTQAEQTAVNTRAVTNHNHCHSMTIFYYTVLRQFHVVTECLEKVPVLLLPFDWPTAPFTDERIVQQRLAIESALLDPRLAPGFDALIDQLNPPPASAPVPRMVRSMTIAVTTGYVNGELDALPPDCAAQLVLQLSGGNTFIKVLREAGQPGWEAAGTQPVQWTLDQPIDLSTMEGVLLEFQNLVGTQGSDNSPTGARSWSVTGMSIDYVTTANERGLLFSKADMNWLAKTTKFKPRTIASWPSGLLTPTIVEAPSVPDPDARARTLAAYELRKHVDANVVYYNRMVALAQDSETRALEWIGKQFLGEPLLNQIDNHPIGAFADKLAYRWTTAPPNLPAAPIYIPQPIEAWVALPTRGVFAEAQLGHCSGCEIIDSTRFWDWQKSPCPERAPTIADVSTATRNQNIIPPSGVTFPTSLVSIQSPPSEPDPTGISDLLKAITTGTAFRDMSGLEQLTTILSALIGAVKPASSSSSSSASKPKSSSSSSSG